jgi:hypothetical protein
VNRAADLACEMPGPTAPLTCHNCGRRRPGIIGGRQADPDGELHGGWQLVSESWMCPPCLIGSQDRRSELAHLPKGIARRAGWDKAGA